MRVVDEILKLLGLGFKVYRGEIWEGVYKELRCLKSYKARWFHKERNYVCLGCMRRCSLSDPGGFQLIIPYPGQFEERSISRKGKSILKLADLVIITSEGAATQLREVGVTVMRKGDVVYWKLARKFTDELTGKEHEFAYAFKRPDQKSIKQFMKSCGKDAHKACGDLCEALVDPDMRAQMVRDFSDNPGLPISFGSALFNAAGGGTIKTGGMGL